VNDRVGWVDLHSHVLPGIDDGPRTLEDALAMATVAVQAGTAVLAATPHVRADHPEVRPDEIADRVAGFNAELARRGIALEVVPGGEVGLVEALELPDDELRLVTLGANGRDLLVETPHGALPSAFERLVDAVRDRGFRVILAHPEHGPDFQRDPRRLGAMVAQGVLLQITAASLTPGRDPWRRLATHVLREGWAHVLASDAHSAGWRPPVLGDGIEGGARSVAGAEPELEWMARDVPRAILAGADLPARPARAPQGGRGLLARLRG
jgi:protein-tyrosine phosphatase